MPNTVPAAATGLPSYKALMALAFDAGDLERFLDVISEILAGGAPDLTSGPNAISRFHSLINIARGAARSLEERAEEARAAVEGRA